MHTVEITLEQVLLARDRRVLRQRELVHFQRFGESLRLVQDDLNKKNFYAFNPDFDKNCC